MAALSEPTSDRLLNVAQALRAGMSIEEVHAACRIDPWFLARIKEIVEAEATIAADGLPDSPAGWLAAKSMGFSDARLGQLTGREEAVVAARRRAAGVRPVYQRLNPCAGQIPPDPPYMYTPKEPRGG